MAQTYIGLHEVNQNAAERSTVSGEIAYDICEFNMAATEMKNSCNHVYLGAAGELNKLVEQLNRQVGMFKV